MTDQLPANMQKKIVANVSTGCWEWTGCLNSRGYGCVGINKKVYLTHRVSYELHIGPIPDGLQIDHLCRNKKCCNPKHLEAVTGKVNCSRTIEATKTHCKNGHPLAGPNLFFKKRTGGGQMRQCRVCQIDTAYRSTMRESKGQRTASEAFAARRSARRSYLIAAGEAALAQEMSA